MLEHFTRRERAPDTFTFKLPGTSSSVRAEGDQLQIITHTRLELAPPADYHEAVTRKRVAILMNRENSELAKRMRAHLRRHMERLEAQTMFGITSREAFARRHRLDPASFRSELEGGF